MAHLHIWAQNNFQGIRAFGRTFQRVTEGKSKFEVPIIHQSTARLGNEQLSQCNYAMLRHRETPNLQVIILSDNDYRIEPTSWLSNSIRTLVGIAEFCPGTAILCISLLSDRNYYIEEEKVRIRQIIESSPKHFFVDIGGELEPSDLSQTRYLSEMGVRKVTRILLKVIMGTPVSAFLE